MLDNGTPEEERAVGFCASEKELALDPGTFELDGAIDVSAIEDQDRLRSATGDIGALLGSTGLDWRLIELLELNSGLPVLKLRAEEMANEDTSMV